MKIWDSNPELVDRLKYMWEVEGLSAGQIAKMLGNGISRNAVIGRIHRTNLKSPYGNVRVTAVKAPAKPKPLPVVHVDAEELEPLVDDSGDPITVANARNGHCRWPYGDLALGTFRYCGHHAKKGAFCAAHARKAYQPPITKGDAA